MLSLLWHKIHLMKAHRLFFCYPSEVVRQRKCARQTIEFLQFCSANNNRLPIACLLTRVRLLPTKHERRIESICFSVNRASRNWRQFIVHLCECLHQSDHSSDDFNDQVLIKDVQFKIESDREDRLWKVGSASTNTC